MMETRREIDAKIAQLEQRLPELVKECEAAEGDALEAFAAEAECLVEHAPAEHLEHIHATISCMLASAGLIPGENEGESCTDK